MGTVGGSRCLGWSGHGFSRCLQVGQRLRIVGALKGSARAGAAAAAQRDRPVPARLPDQRLCHPGICQPGRPHPPRLASLREGHRHGPDN